ncbi:HAD hydrolase family protein [bacterium]|nr:HAD hydrolase family protein [bacterium]NIN92787.1 HAD hydrolase family protein [bacterium]NIO18768.1 HAD hydrolase family protein [bacterium]NIO73844.1 HAD hydrolase family protein [bacterium]
MQFITDCEGPISKNDNALELATNFLPEGEKFFTQLSRYDDFLALTGREGYKAGDTLRLILPFLKAHGTTDRKIVEYSKNNILLMPGAKETLRFVQERMPSFIVSTSYQPYIQALCEVIEFPRENVYCTELNIDKYNISKEEIGKLKEFGKEILAYSLIDVSEINNLNSQTKEAIDRLEEIFWKEIVSMESGRMLEEVNPVGGREKVDAIKDSLKKCNNNPKDAMYVGDSITDREALSFVRENGGLAVSFNGNRYAIEKAEVVCISENTSPISVLADVFCQGGKRKVMELVENWKEKLPLLEVVRGNNKERLTSLSERFRKSVRGEAGSLG